MLSLLRQQPTILDYVHNWWSRDCSCGNPVDVCWVPTKADPDGHWADKAWIATSCPNCVIAAAPERFRSPLTERYQRIRRDRLALGLGSIAPEAFGVAIEPNEPADRSLKGQAGTVTLNSGLWAKPNAPQSRDLVMDQLLIAGTLNAAAPSDVDLIEGVAPLPHFDLHDINVLGSTEATSVREARLLLGATITDRKLPGLEWRYAWNQSVPASFGFFSLPPYWQEWAYTPREIGRFVARAMYLFQRRSGGRSIETAREDYLREIRAYMDANEGERPKRDQFLENHALFSLRQYQRHKAPLGLGNWHDLCREAQDWPPS